MTEITKIRGADSSALATSIQTSLRRQGYSSRVTAKDHSVSVQQVRLAEGQHNLQVSQSTKSGYRKTNALSWNDWVKVNNTLNSELNKKNASANIKSLGGKFKIREGTHAFTEEDWENLKYENVGSQMNPITRYDYIQEVTRTDKSRQKKKMKDVC